jgi:NADH-quinone oxidoreductase subunit N
MLSLAGIPGTVGFIGKFQLIHALVNGGYTWLAVVLVIGSMISLGYYLRVIATMWMSPATSAPAPSPAGLGTRLAPIAGGSPEADSPAPPPADPLGGAGSAPGPPWEVVGVAVVFAGASIVFGIIPSPLFAFAAHAGRALGLF